MSYRIRRFYLTWLGVNFFGMGLFDLGHYLFGTNLLPTQQEPSYLIAIAAHLLMGYTFGHSAWRAHRLIVSGEAKEISSHYPRAEAAIYAVGGLIVLTGAWLVAESSARSFEFNDAWERVEAVFTIGCMLVGGLGSLVISAGILRRSKAKF